MKTGHLVLVVCLVLAVVAQAEDTTQPSSGPVPPAPTLPARTPPIPMIDFPDQIPMHNMGIASDGAYYYTCNGGNAGVGQINTYDLGGNLVQSTPCLIDMRAIFFNFADSQLYAKNWGTDLYRVDPVTGDATLVHAGIFAHEQSSPALTPDGQTLLEHEDGTVRFIDVASGSLIDTLAGLYCGGYPSNEAVGTDGARIFTWDGALVHVYAMDGIFLESYNLPSGNYGFSLKFVNDLLFASDDGGGGTGHWWGYDVGSSVAVEAATWGDIKTMFR